MEYRTVQSGKLAEDYISALIADNFGSTVAVDYKTIRENTLLGSELGFPEEDRTIRADLVDYLLCNFSLIYLGLLVNEDFRNKFREAVEFEMELADRSKDYSKDRRTQVQGGLSEPSEHNVIINLGSFNLSVARNISGRIKASMDKLTPFAEEYNSIVREVTDEDAARIGYCICNFMYLIKAFEKNPSFRNYVRKVVKAVGDGLGIA